MKGIEKENNIGFFQRPAGVEWKWFGLISNGFNLPDPPGVENPWLHGYAP
jgi:hypothetical protein